jgi:K+-transporting ATPase ATPase A chain
MYPFGLGSGKFRYSRQRDHPIDGFRSRPAPRIILRTMAAWIELAFFLIVLTRLTPALGGYMAAVFEGEPNAARRIVGRCERRIYQICRIDERQEMTWREYLGAAVVFSGVSALALFVALIGQRFFPLNPQAFANLPPLLALNVAISFMTTTDWQAYAGETTLGYLAQMLLGWQNFVGAAVGSAVAIAAIRGFRRSGAVTLGNFWVDLTRSWLYVLLPISIAGAVLFVWQGTPQNLSAYAPVRTLEGGNQTITGGPIASQEIIKQLGVNGGGFVAANSAAPNENPTPLTDWIGCLAMFLIGAGLTNTFGRLVGDARQGWMLYAVMTVLFMGGFLATWLPEHAGNPLIHQLGVHGPNLEGKEVRFGDASGALSVTAATDTSSGASNVAYDSLMPLATLVTLVNMQIGEVVFGGVGSGLYGMIILAILAVFIAGLMVGRTPEYLGKKIERREITLVVLASLIPALTTLMPTAIALLPGLSTVGNSGPHGFSEILYAFTSVSANNGSSMGGLGVQTDFYNALTAVVMLLGRFGTMVVILALVGGLVRKTRNMERTRGQLSTTTPLFGALLTATALVVTALTFVPADALGPIAEQLVLQTGRSF